jgi:hypothetical protein
MLHKLFSIYFISFRVFKYIVMIILFSSTLFKHICRALLVNFKKNKIPFSTLPLSCILRQLDISLMNTKVMILETGIWWNWYDGPKFIMSDYLKKVSTKMRYVNNKHHVIRVTIGPPHPLLCRKSLRGDWMGTHEDPG